MAFFQLDNTGAGRAANHATNRTYTNTLAAQTDSHPYSISNATSHAVNYKVTAATTAGVTTVRIGKVTYLDNHHDGEIVWLTETSDAHASGSPKSQSVNFTVDAGDTDILVVAVNGTGTFGATVAINGVQARHATSASQGGRIYFDQGNNVTGWTAS